MLVVGLTGGIGSGKSTVAELFEKLGAGIIDADIVARQVVAPGSQALAAIANRFGDEYLLADGNLNRSLLREQIFSNPEDKAWLENLLHPLISESIQELIDNSTAAYILLVSPLLLETDQHRLVDRILVVDVAEQTQLERTLERDGGNQSTIQSIMESQMERKQRLANADDVINNERSLADLDQEVATLHQHYLTLAAAETRP